MSPPTDARPHAPDARERLEQAHAARADARYELCLYVVGMTQRSSEAISAIKGICEAHLHDRYDLKVVDIAAAPDLARTDQIVAAPTLVKRLPLPMRRLIGNLSNTERVMHALDLAPSEAA
jgi:circadian clock protein KaiB